VCVVAPGAAEYEEQRRVLVSRLPPSDAARARRDAARLFRMSERDFY
jgi:hypothetical protein